MGITYMILLARFKKYLTSISTGVFQTIVEVPAFRPITDGISEGPPLLARAFAGQNLGEFLTSLFNIAISVGAILAVLRIGYAGFKYMTTDSAGEKGGAKEIIQNAVLGLLLLLGIVLILERINPDILKFNLDLQSSAGSATRPPVNTGGLPIAP